MCDLAYKMKGYDCVGTIQKCLHSEQMCNRMEITVFTQHKTTAYARSKGYSYVLYSIQ